MEEDWPASPEQGLTIKGPDENDEDNYNSEQNEETSDENEEDNYNQEEETYEDNDGDNYHLEEQEEELM